MHHSPHLDSPHPEPPRRAPRHAPAAATALQCLAWLALFLLAWVTMLWQAHLLSHGHLAPPGHRHVGGDFTIYWVSGEHLRRGADAYAPVVGPLGFVYPPFALMPFALLSLLALPTAYVVWLGICAAGLTGVVALAHRRGLSPWAVAPLLLAMLMEGYVSHGTWLGQIGIVLFALVCWDIVGVRNPRLGGLLLGIAIGIKFTPAVFLLIPCVRRQWRRVVNAMLGFAGTVLVGVAMSPSNAARYWNELLVHHQLGTGVPTWFGSANNQSLTNAWMMLLGSTDHTHLVVARGLSMVLGLTVMLAGVRAVLLGREWLSIGLLGIASCLVTTSTWDHHYVWFCALLVALAQGELRRMHGSSLLLVAWMLWGFGSRWKSLIHVPLARLGTSRLLEATATPLLAVVFGICCLIEMRDDLRDRARVRTARGRVAEFGAVGQNRRVDHEGE